MANSVKIFQMTGDMVNGVSNVHMQAFKGSMNTRLGKFYVKKVFDWFVKVENGIALVAKKGGASEEIVGYVIGAPLGYAKAMNRDLFWVAFFNILIRPWLFFNEHFRAIVKSRLKGFMLIFQDRTYEVALPMPVMSLVGLAVKPSQQGKNIGKELLLAFERRAFESQVGSLRLSVYPGNLSARRVYEKCGWLPIEDQNCPGDAMNYYKIL